MELLKLTPKEIENYLQGKDFKDAAKGNIYSFYPPFGGQKTITLAIKDIHGKHYKGLIICNVYGRDGKTYLSLENKTYEIKDFRNVEIPPFLTLTTFELTDSSEHILLFQVP